MPHKNPSLRFIVFVSALLSLLVGCTSLSPVTPPTQTPQATEIPPTSTRQPTQIPVPVTPPDDIPDNFTPTVTSTADLSTPTPLPLEFNKTNGFGDGYVAHVLIADVDQLKEEDILRLLVTQWLEHCKTEEMDPDAAIKDYKIEGMQPLTVHGYYKEPIFRAIVSFSIIPAKDPKQDPPFEWGTMIDTIDTPWIHMKGKLGVFGRKNESLYYWLDFAGAAG